MVAASVSVPPPLLVTEPVLPEAKEFENVTGLPLVSKVAPAEPIATVLAVTSNGAANRMPPPFKLMPPVPKLPIEDAPIKPAVTFVPPV